jgi:hypothetical protein
MPKEPADHGSLLDERDQTQVTSRTGFKPSFAISKLLSYNNLEHRERSAQCG